MTNEVPSVSFGDRLFALLQYLLPKHLLSRVIYAVARSEAAWVRNTFLRIFLRSYRIDLAEAIEPDPFAYPSFNAFFTRALKAAARPIDTDANVLVSPVDGTAENSEFCACAWACAGSKSIATRARTSPSAGQSRPHTATVAGVVSMTLVFSAQIEAISSRSAACL